MVTLSALFYIVTINPTASRREDKQRTNKDMGKL